MPGSPAIGSKSAPAPHLLLTKSYANLTQILHQVSAHVKRPWRSAHANPALAPHGIEKMSDGSGLGMSELLANLPTDTCDECGNDGFKYSCPGDVVDEGNYCLYGRDDNEPMRACESCFMGREYPEYNDVYRCANHQIIPWDFTDAFDKWGFNDGSNTQSITIAEDIAALGYKVAVYQWGTHNEVISQIVRTQDGMGETIEDELTPEQIADINGVLVYPPEGYQPGGYDERPVWMVLPPDIMEAINRYHDTPGFVSIELPGPVDDGKRVLRAKGSLAIIEAFNARDDTDIVCSFCLQTKEHYGVVHNLRRGDEVKTRNFVVPACESTVPHLFHKHCFKKYLRKTAAEITMATNRNKCPLCKSVVVGAKSPEPKSESQELDF